MKEMTELKMVYELVISRADPHHKTLTPFEKYCIAMLRFAERCIYK